jgi:hypothetical protein
MPVRREALGGPVSIGLTATQSGLRQQSNRVIVSSVPEPAGHD